MIGFSKRKVNMFSVLPLFEVVVIVIMHFLTLSS